MTLRLRFWLLAMDAITLVELVTRADLHASYLRCVARASDATDWGEGAKCGEELPW